MVVYYTRYGTTAVVAREIARELGAELREIRAKRRHSWPVMGFSAVFNIRHRIELMDFDFSRCGLVVLCSPIWASKPACPVMSFLDAAKLDDTRSALLFTAWSRETGRIAEAMKGILQRRGSRLVASESLLIRRVPEETLRTQAREFALELKKKH